MTSLNNFQPDSTHVSVVAMAKEALQNAVQMVQYGMMYTLEYRTEETLSCIHGGRELCSLCGSSSQYAAVDMCTKAIAFEGD